MKRVALLTHSGDEYVPDLVAGAIRRRGDECIRIDTDTFPSSASLTVTEAGRALYVDDAASLELDLVRCDAFWLRRIYTAHALDVEPHWRAQCAAQASDALAGTLAMLNDSGAHVVNDLAAQSRAEHKVVQLRAARTAKLTMPATIITNDLHEARAFVRAQRDNVHDVVTKLLVPLSQTTDASLPFMYTSAVDDADAAALDGIRSAPMILQARVDKRADVRAVVIGERVIAGALATTSLDWRAPAAAMSATWRAHDLARDVEKCCVAVVRELGLSFAALDFVVDGAGAHWFLEVNPAGEWGFLERDAGLPVSDALAAHLLSRP